MKKAGTILYESKLKGRDQGNATIEARGVKEQIKITIRHSTPRQKTNEWLAEQLMISYASTAFMRTFLDLAEQNDITITGFECDAIGDAALENKIPRINSLNIYPKIYVEQTSSLSGARILIETSMKNNPAEKMFPAGITYHPVIEVRGTTNDSHGERREVFF